MPEFQRQTIGEWLWMLVRVPATTALKMLRHWKSLGRMPSAAPHGEAHASVRVGSAAMLAPFILAPFILAQSGSFRLIPASRALAIASPLPPPRPQSAGASAANCAENAFTAAYPQDSGKVQRLFQTCDGFCSPSFTKRSSAPFCRTARGGGAGSFCGGHGDGRRACSN